MAKCDGGIFLIHVDDLLFVGDSLRKFQEHFTISSEQLGESGSAVSFLKDCQVGSWIGIGFSQERKKSSGSF